MPITGTIRIRVDRKGQIERPPHVLKPWFPEAERGGPTEFLYPYDIDHFGDGTLVDPCYHGRGNQRAPHLRAFKRAQKWIRQGLCLSMSDWPVIEALPEVFFQGEPFIILWGSASRAKGRHGYHIVPVVFQTKPTKANGLTRPKATLEWMPLVDIDFRQYGLVMVTFNRLADKNRKRSADLTLRLRRQPAAVH